MQNKIKNNSSTDPTVPNPKQMLARKVITTESMELFYKSIHFGSLLNSHMP
jgi:hypothetical protein